MGKFNKGLFLGGLLGAALMWLNVTKEGKATRDRALDYAADMYADVKKQVMRSDAWQTMNESKYAALVTDTVNVFAAKNKVANDVKELAGKILKKQWKRLQQEMREKK